MEKKSKVLLGILFIFLGILILLSSLDIIQISFFDFWTYFLLILGLMFEFSFFFSKKKEAGVLIPAGILITISAVFIVCQLFGWHMMKYLWPLFIMAPGIGLFQSYVFGPKYLGLLISSLILLTIGSSFLVSIIFKISIINLVISAILIVIGLILIFNNNSKKVDN